MVKKGKKNGFVLVELIVAIVIASIAFSLLYRTFYQMLKASRNVKNHFTEKREYDRLLDHLKKDLQNAVQLSNMPFSGNAGSLTFVLWDDGFSFVEYSYKDNAVYRKEEQIAGENGSSDENRSSVKKLNENVDECFFEYAYSDGESHLFYSQVWNEEYLGVPRGVKVSIKGTDNPDFRSHLIFIPQGNLGTLTTG